MRGVFTALVALLTLVSCGSSSTDLTEPANPTSAATRTTPSGGIWPSRSITPSPQPAPTLSDDELADAEYIALLVSKGVEIGDRDKLIQDAATVCVYLSQSGTTLIDAGTGLIDEYGYNGTKASAIVDAAITVRCPEYD